MRTFDFEHDWPNGALATPAPAAARGPFRATSPETGPSHATDIDARTQPESRTPQAVTREMSVADALAAHVGRKPVRLAAPPAREPLTAESPTDEPFESGAALSALPQPSVTPRAQTAATDAAAIDAVVADLVAEATLKQAGASLDRADADTQRAAAHDESQDDVLASLTAMPEPLPRRRFDTTPIAWGGLGFIAGALVWHFIGFWAFVSTIVLNQDADQRTVV
ncbi:MAG: hypothetical protein ACRCS9_01185, partial [Hyphomicrobium sp.]